MGVFDIQRTIEIALLVKIDFCYIIFVRHIFSEMVQVISPMV